MISTSPFVIDLCTVVEISLGVAGGLILVNVLTRLGGYLKRKLK